MITTWYGRNVETLTREELLEVINDLAKEVAEYRRPEAIRARSLGMVEMMKRGETYF